MEIVHVIAHEASCTQQRGRLQRFPIARSGRPSHRRSSQTQCGGHAASGHCAVNFPSAFPQARLLADSVEKWWRLTYPSLSQGYQPGLCVSLVDAAVLQAILSTARCTLSMTWVTSAISLFRSFSATSSLVHCACIDAFPCSPAQHEGLRGRISRSKSKQVSKEGGVAGERAPAHPLVVRNTARFAAGVEPDGPPRPEAKSLPPARQRLSCLGGA
jgi:hypothetical protein